MDGKMLELLLYRVLRVQFDRPFFHRHTNLNILDNNDLAITDNNDLPITE